MPSGYTAKLFDGEQDFRDFVHGAARGMAFMITMRDAPADAPFPEEFKPQTDYHEKEILRAEESYRRFMNMTDEEAEAAADDSYNAQMAAYKKSQEEDQIRSDRYQNMISQVQAWEVDPILDSFKDAMIKWLQESDQFDNVHGLGFGFPSHLSGKDYREGGMATALRDIDYHTEEIQKEIERTAERNKYLKALREALDKVSQAV